MQPASILSHVNQHPHPFLQILRCFIFSYENHMSSIYQTWQETHVDSTTKKYRSPLKITIKSFIHKKITMLTHQFIQYRKNRQWVSNVFHSTWYGVIIIRAGRSVVIVCDLIYGRPWNFTVGWLIVFIRRRLRTSWWKMHKCKLRSVPMRGVRMCGLSETTKTFKCMRH